MQDSNNVRSSTGDSYTEYATSIPTAPAALSTPRPPEPASIPAAPTYSSTQRNTRLSRVLLRRTLRSFGTLGRLLWPFRLTLAIAALLLSIIAWMGVQLWWPVSTAQPAFARSESIAPVPSVEMFIKGQQSFNADMMWESLSPELQEQQLAKGATKLLWQTRADRDKQAGQRYLAYKYIGGVKLEEGGGMFFYMVDVESPQAERNGPASYVFTVNSNGKILSIE